MRRWRLSGPLRERFIDADHVETVGGAAWFYNGVNRRGHVVEIVNKQAWNSIAPVGPVPAEGGDES